jgi:hypothetical protein
MTTTRLTGDASRVTPCHLGGDPTELGDAERVEQSVVQRIQCRPDVAGDEVFHLATKTGGCKVGQ